MKTENGYIVVETVGAFIPFVLLVVSILSLVNIVTAQVRIHYALTQTAGTLSMYSYTLKAAGVSDELAAIDAKASNIESSFNDVMDGINFLSGNGGDFSDINRMLDSAQQAAGDPKAMIQNLVNFGINEARSSVSAALIAKPLFMRYLASGKTSAEEYLQGLRIINLDITECIIVDRNENVRITAEYEVEYTFGALRLPFTPTLRISQTVITKAWVGGSGDGYRG